MDTSKNVAFNVSEDNIPDQQNSESESESEETPLKGMYCMLFSCCNLTL